VRRPFGTYSLDIKCDSVSIIEDLIVMGHSESDSIKTPVLTGWTKKAHKIVAKRATGNRAADSADDWFRMNLPKMG
jgi:hypothetical protein